MPRTGRQCTPIDPTKKYGLLTPLRPAAERDQHGREQWHCLCDCGGKTIVKATYLRTGETISCGCRKRAGNRRTHGCKTAAGATPAYLAWSNMKRRCSNPKLKSWKNYGGRGISYDPRWEKFEDFLADMGEPAEGQTLDREDNDGNYCKDNCRWVSHVVQSRNRRSNRLVTIHGESMPLAEAVERFAQVSYFTVLNRLNLGWSDHDAVLTAKTHRWASPQFPKENRT